MSLKRADFATGLFTQVNSIRNVCILAHVDHGKTTLADALLATNGLVSQRQAGKLRYMDNTEAEQKRGITMKSSTAGLIFNTLNKDEIRQTYLINLVDSPGHVDFASEVSTAVRLCDAAIIVIDVIEGVCPQTRAVLRQAWSERLTLLLVLNKIDRLAIEVKLTPLQAYETICRVLEQVNSVLAEMYVADIAKQIDMSEDLQPDGSAVGSLWTNDMINTDDSSLYFSPDRGNVIFASAFDSWGFRPVDFVDLWSSRLDVSRDELVSVIWGDYYLTHLSKSSSKTTFKSEARAAGKRPVFVQLILEPIWKAYEALSSDKCTELITSMVGKLNLKLDKRLLRSAITDNRGHVRTFLSLWLPLGPSVMQTVVDICPSPLQAVSPDRAVHMLYGDLATHIPCQSDTTSTIAVNKHGAVKINQISRSTLDAAYASSGASLAIQACSADENAPVVIFVAKVFWAENSSLTGSHSHRSIPKPRDPALVERATAVNPPSIEAVEHTGPRPMASAATSAASSSPSPWSESSRRALVNETEFVALARVFSGVVRAGQKLFVIGPKFDGNKVPAYLLDADPEDFPVGPVRLSKCPDVEAEASVPSTPTVDELLGVSPVASSPDAVLKSHSDSMHSSGGGSSEEGWRSSRRPPLLRHVYVAPVSRILQFLGGQRDLLELTVPVPSGNIIGLTGSDLINFIPKSGLLVSRLSLVAGGGSSRAPFLPLTGLASWHGAPVVSVAVEPASVSDVDDVERLEQGLRLLDRADPCAEITLASTGEYLIKAAGEVHLQKCLEDLSRYFAPGVELQVSPFVVPFRETVLSTGTIVNTRCLALMSSDSYNRALRQLDSLIQQFDLATHANGEKQEEAGQEPVKQPPEHTVASVTDGQQQQQQRRQLEIKIRPARNLASRQTFDSRYQAAFTVDADLPTADCPLGYFILPHSRTRTRLLLRVTAHPLPRQLIDWVESRGGRKVLQLIKAFKTKSPCYDRLVEQLTRDLSAVCAAVVAEASETGDATTSTDAGQTPVDWSSLPHSLLALGPNQTGPNILFTRLQTNCFPLFTAWGQRVSGGDVCRAGSNGGISLPQISYAKALLRGFQLATERGPLCSEPMHGVLFILEEICADDCFLLEVPKPGDVSAPAGNPGDVGGSGAESTNEMAAPVVDAALDPVDSTQEEPNHRGEARRRKSRRLTSISWFDDTADKAAQEEEDDAFWGNGSLSRDPYDEWLSSDSDGNASQRQSGVDGDSDDDDDAGLKPDPADERQRIEQQQHLEDIPFWRRRTDTDWLQDVPPGSLTPAMARACLAAFQADCLGQRLMLAMYDVELQARRDVLGRMIGVLHRRHGRVVSEDYREGENLIIINARLPVIESFGLTEELRDRTSGLVSFPQLRPGGWEVLDVDPVQRDPTAATTTTMPNCPVEPSGGPANPGTLSKSDGDGETGRNGRRKAGGATGSGKNRRAAGGGKALGNVTAPQGGETNDDDDCSAMPNELNSQAQRVRHYIRETRTRKGLSVNEQLVLFADKQRTLKKNK